VFEYSIVLYPLHWFGNFEDYNNPDIVLNSLTLFICNDIVFSFDVTAKNAELFIYKLYNVSNVTKVNKACEMQFVKSSAPETLTSTGDALSFHIQRAHYQTAVW